MICLRDQDLDKMNCYDGEDETKTSDYHLIESLSTATIMDLENNKKDGILYFDRDEKKRTFAK